MSPFTSSLFHTCARALAFASFSALLLSSCAGGDHGEDALLAEDAEDASFGVIGGKADGHGPTTCQVETLLTLLNERLYEVEALKDAGVHTRAAKSISAHLLGPDGVFGTSDDASIETLEQLDAIKYVGPAALEQMLAIAQVDGATCGVGQVVTDVIFSPQPSDATHLVRVAEEIDRAERSLDIAMYSFSNYDILYAIERAIARGVKVRVIFEPAKDDRHDPAGTMSWRLEEAGANVRYVNKIMHHKYVLIDGPREDLALASSGTLISGSANWSNSAGTRYDENTVFITGSEELNLRFQREFNLLWEHSRELEWGGAKEWDMNHVTIEEADIPVDPHVHAVFTSANFKTTFSSRYGETFSRVRGRDEIANFLVSHIEEAKSSILIASGHLRSRPVAEAIMAKRMTDPDVEIRVYLDGQEFISDYWSGKQQRDLDDCLVEAGDSQNKIEDCYDKGFYFGYALGQAGVDVRYKAYSYRWHYRTAAQMHHKYLILDRETVIQGSYNLSDNAEHNTMENMALYSGAPFASLAASYVENFEAMWETGRAEGLYDEMMTEIDDAGAGDSIPIVFDSMALTWEELDAYKDRVREVCPVINSTDYRDNPDKHYVCELPD